MIKLQCVIKKYLMKKSKEANIKKTDELPENFINFMNCLLDMYKDLKNQGYYFDEDKRLVSPEGEKSECPKPKHIPQRLYDEEK